MARGGARAGCFVTACNPQGRLLPHPRNRRAMARLRWYLRGCRLRFAEAEGRGHGGDWPAEPSLLVFGLDRARAATLGRRWRQNAVVHVRRGQPAVLLALR
nr:DUF3293 domain-containing protein [Limobrevibacterium gyesilva]